MGGSAAALRVFQAIRVVGVDGVAATARRIGCCADGALSRLPPRRARSQAERQGAVQASPWGARAPVLRVTLQSTAGPPPFAPMNARDRTWGAIAQGSTAPGRLRASRRRQASALARAGARRSAESPRCTPGRAPVTRGRPPLNTPPHRLLCGPAPTVRKGLVVKAKVRLRPYTSSVANCIPTLNPSPCNMYRSGIILGLRCPQVMSLSPDTH